jgi:hypothetical protein
MKIAITGHSAGIGQALAKVYESQGHEILGLSRRNGYNIRSIPKIIDKVEPCDMFINNAQVGFAQTELLYGIYKKWQGIANKKIINISSMMTLEPISPLPGIDMIEYHTQKLTLEEAHRQLLHLHNIWPKLCLVKPGATATQPGQTSPYPYADVDHWAQTLVTILDLAGQELEVGEISLGVNYK